MARKADRPTYVYAIECAGYVKIGIAECTDERLGGMRVNCPLPLSLIARRQYPSRDAARRAERECHAALSRQHHVGEWYAAGELCPVQVLLATYENSCPDEPVSEPIDPRRPFRPFDTYALDLALKAVRAADLWTA